jgi:hypothetical protein
MCVIHPEHLLSTPIGSESVSKGLQEEIRFPNLASITITVDIAVMLVGETWREGGKYTWMKERRKYRRYLLREREVIHENISFSVLLDHPLQDRHSS